MGACCARLRAELAIENLNFDASTSTLGMLNWRETFGHDSNRCINSWGGYLAFRCVNFAIMLGALALSIYYEVLEGRPWHDWFFFLTHWTLLFEVIYLGLAAFTTYASKAAWEDKASNKLPWYVSIMWALHAIVLPASFMVFAMYWGLVFSGPPVYVVSVMTHGANFVVMFADFLVGNTPYLLLHGLYFFAYSAGYVLWSSVHYAAGLKTHEDCDRQGGNCDKHRYIYGSLDWGQPGTKRLSLVILLLGVPLINLLFWSITLCRGPVGGGQGSKDNGAQPGGDGVEVPVAVRKPRGTALA